MLIAIDHGNKQIKTVHAMPFTSGLIQSDALGFGTDFSSSKCEKAVIEPVKIG